MRSKNNFTVFLEMTTVFCNFVSTKGKQHKNERTYEKNTAAYFRHCDHRLDNRGNNLV